MPVNTCFKFTPTAGVPHETSQITNQVSGACFTGCNRAPFIRICSASVASLPEKSDGCTYRHNAIADARAKLHSFCRTMLFLCSMFFSCTVKFFCAIFNFPCDSVFKWSNTKMLRIRKFAVRSVLALLMAEAPLCIQCQVFANKIWDAIFIAFLYDEWQI